MGTEDWSGMGAEELADELELRGVNGLVVCEAGARLIMTDPAQKQAMEAIMPALAAVLPQEGPH